MSRKNLKTSYWLGVFFTISLAFFIWIGWKKLDAVIGNSNITLVILFFIVLTGIVLGRLKLDNILKRIG